MAQVTQSPEFKPQSHQKEKKKKKKDKNEAMHQELELTPCVTSPDSHLPL
jgi:hypothetical protein